MTTRMLRRTLVAVPTSVALVVPLVGSATSADAAGSNRSALSLVAPSAAPYGSKIALKGTLSKRGTSTRIASGRVYLQRSLHGRSRWAAVTSTVTSRTGTYAFTVSQGTPFDYRTVYAGSRTYTAAVSPVRYPVVGQKVLLTRQESFELGNQMTVQGVRYPAAPLSNGIVYLQRYNASRKLWQNIGSGRARANGTFRIEAQVGGSIAYYRIFAPAQRGYGAGYSAARRYARYASRGAFVKPLLAKGGTNRTVFDPLTWSEDKEQKTAVVFANDNGTSWGDINVAGCKSLFFLGRNPSDGQVKLSVLAGTTVLDEFVFNPGADLIDHEWVGIGGRSRLRILVSDVSSTGPHLVLRLEPSCVN